jgi:hypothetical protein
MVKALWSLPAAAQDASVGVRLALSSPAGCPGSTEFVRAVERRGVELRIGARDERAVEISVSVAPVSEGVLGRLVMVGPDGSRSERTVTTANCSQATEALALIVALALRRAAVGDLSVPHADSSADSPTPSPEPAPGSTPSPLPGSPAAQAAAAPTIAVSSSGARAASAAVAKDWPEDPGRASIPARAHAWAFEASGAGLGAVGLAPDVVAGIAVRVGATLPRYRSSWAPSFRIAVADTIDRSFPGGLGTGTFGMLASSVEACPLTAFAVGAASLRPCASAEVGVLRASGSDTANPRDQSRLWTAAGVEGIYSVPIAGPIFWDATLGALVVIDRYRFTIGSGTVFETPAIVGRIALGLGAKID